MNDKNSFFLNHILDSCKNIIEFTINVDYQTFTNKRLLQSAVIRELEIIGEASKNLTDSRKRRFQRDTLEKINWNERYINPRIFHSRFKRSMEYC